MLILFCNSNDFSIKKPPKQAADTLLLEHPFLLADEWTVE